MLIRQTKNTFIRFFHNKAYLSNQLTRFDRVYNDIGADFLRYISRKPVSCDFVIGQLKNLYGDSVTLEELSNEFLSFVNELVRTKFLVTGNSREELDSKDLVFSYAMENPKTLVRNFTQETKDLVDEHTLCVPEKG